MYSTSFLSGSAGYDIVYCDVVWVPKFAAAGWLLDLTGKPSSADIDDYLPVFMRNWPYVWTILKESALRIEDRVGLTSMVRTPGQNSAATLGGWGFAISRFSRNPEAAWEFVKFVTAPEQLRKAQMRIGLIPARRSLVPLEFAPILDSARMRPPIPEYAQASDILQRWLSAAITGRVDPRALLGV
jgi:multiple sugar transport system substrate-binding protein